MAIQVNTDHSTVPPTPTNWELWLDDVASSSSPGRVGRRARATA